MTVNMRVELIGDKYQVRTDDTNFFWLDDIRGGDTPIEALEEVGDLELTDEEASEWLRLYNKYSV